MSHDHQDHVDESQNVPVDQESQGVEPVETANKRDFEDLTLSETVGQLVRAPFRTVRSLFQVARDTSDQPAITLPETLAPTSAPSNPRNSNPAQQIPTPRRISFIPLLSIQHYAGLMLFILAFLLAFTGDRIMVSENLRSEATSLHPAALWLIGAFFVWVVAEFYFSWSAIRSWWNSQTPAQHLLLQLRAIPVGILLISFLIIIVAIFSAPYSVDVWTTLDIGLILAAVGGVLWFVGLALGERWRPATSTASKTQTANLSVNGLVIRGFLAVVGLILSSIAWSANTGNQFTAEGVLAWIASVVVWSLALSPSNWNPFQEVVAQAQKLRQFRPRWTWTATFLVLIILVGAYFRLHNLDGDPALGASVPPEMTSDHVEKLLDAQRILDGNHQVFFANNGGREPFQMYAMAFFSQIPGLGMNFGTLKLLAVVESLLTLPILFLMGREIVGTRDARLGNTVGLLLALLVAVSYWHVAITRLALRIVLTPAVVGLLMIYLTRALRYNRRGDFIKAGLVLGFGLYTYQAVRMLPVVVIVAVLVAIAFNAHTWRIRLRYLLNFIALVIIAVVAFVPLFSFSLDTTVQGPELFWLRTSGRLFGDNVIETTDEQGNVVNRQPTLQERFDAFNQNLPILVSNIRNAMLMYNWKGDVAWINGAPNYPEMDAYTGALFIVGLGAWLALMLRRRDVVDWLVPLALLIMLLPSALSIAFPGENPSATRTSGSLPFAYLIAALPLALLAQETLRIGGKWIGRAVTAAMLLVIVGGAFVLNMNLYFNDYRISYEASSLPYSEGGRFLRGFAESDGSYGNAFLIGYPAWWDTRALGIEAGRLDWANGIISRDEVPIALLQAAQRTDRYLLDLDKDIIFFYSINDNETRAQLQLWFPNGRDQTIVSYQAGDDFSVYRVPALGVQGFAAFLESNEVGQP